MKTTSAVFVGVVVLSVCQVIVPTTYGSTLELLQIVYRHGDRTPTKTFPTDPNAGVWLKMGLGQLTNIGKVQHFNLGQYFKRKYSGYLSEAYNGTEVYVWSTDMDRTLMSAQCNLAGMYPPNGSEIWDDGLLWQPIPIHTLPVDLDYAFDDVAPCPQYESLLNQQLQSPEMQQIDKENEDLYKLLTDKTGRDVTGIMDVSTIYGNLLAAKCNGLPWPDWVTPPLMSRMSHCHDLKFVWRSKTVEMCRLLGGPMWGTLLQNIESKVNGTMGSRRALFYFSHDTVISAALSALGIFNDVAPPYSCSLVVELLRETANGGYAVQLLYHNTTTAEPFVLTVPKCTAPCPLDRLVALTRDVISDDVVKECGN